MAAETIRLTFRAADLDTRITMRGTIEALRQDACVLVVEEVPPSLDEDVPEHTYTFEVLPRFGVDLSPLLRGLSLSQPRDIPEPPPLESFWLRGTIHPFPEESVERLHRALHDTGIHPEDLIQRALQSPTGRSRLAQAMVAPLRQRMDYQSLARRTFLVEELPPGALPVYDRDPEPGRFREVSFVESPADLSGSPRTSLEVGFGYDANGSPVPQAEEDPTPPAEERLTVYERLLNGDWDGEA